MSVKIRMKRLGRKHRPYFRICAIDSRSPRDGRVIEELGTYDPLISETDGRTRLDYERIQYWLGVGAQPSDKVRILIKKYGLQGTRTAEQQAARDRLAAPKTLPEAGAPAYIRPEKTEKSKKPAAEAAPPAEPAEPAAAAEPEPAAEASAPAE